MVYCVPVAVIRQIWRMLAVEYFGQTCLTGPKWGSARWRQKTRILTYCRADASAGAWSGFYRLSGVW
jgi:hypothetical protein